MQLVLVEVDVGEPGDGSPPAAGAVFLPVLLLPESQLAALPAELPIRGEPIALELQNVLPALRELLRQGRRQTEGVLERNGVRFRPLLRTAEINGQPLDLTDREYELFGLFMRNPGRLLTRAEIVEAVWGARDKVSPNLLDVHMSRLRSKLEGALGGPVFRTVRGAGYELL